MTIPLTTNEIRLLRLLVDALPIFTIKVVKPSPFSREHASLVYDGDFDPLEPEKCRQVLEFAATAAQFLPRLLDQVDPPGDIFVIHEEKVDGKTLDMIKGFQKPRQGEVQ